MVDFLLTPCGELTGVGPVLARKLALLGLKTVFDLLSYLPLRYEDRTRFSSKEELTVGSMCLLKGELSGCQIVRAKRSYLRCILVSDIGILTLIFFNYKRYRLDKIYLPGVRVICYGEISYFQGQFLMVHPELKLLRLTEPFQVERTLLPIYRGGAGITSNFLRKLVRQILLRLENSGIVEEHLTAELRQILDLPTLLETFKTLHFPFPGNNVLEQVNRQTSAFKRLIFEELAVEYLSKYLSRLEHNLQVTLAISWDEGVHQAFLKRLPFQLTTEQERVIREIQQDIENTVPMARLLQGEVGCGKTIVAACVVQAVAHCGLQSVIMAPTELLVQQHAKNFRVWFPQYKVVCLSSGLRSKEKKELLQEIQHGLALIIVGTHALLEEAVQFASLALVVIDEQHRFGVEQRFKLFKKGVVPHQLIMTATPIPRSLAMVLFGDLDFSTIRSKPNSRLPIRTTLLGKTRLELLLNRIKQYCVQGGQVYWICPLISEQEATDLAAAESRYLDLQGYLAEVAVGILHGRLTSEEKQTVMQLFVEGKLQVLVATTVVEVGIDVKSANLMVIENAERLGLVQLHQLRGRVGRGGSQGFCVLLYGEKIGENARKRLQLLQREEDGLALAQADLLLRGKGELLGFQQSGQVNFRFFNPQEDQIFCEYLGQLRGHFLLAPNFTERLLQRWLGKKLTLTKYKV